ncbi:hypothetical protein HPB49_010570 [Dermacentor silvarum]|uniref:Uncharacterized protein n=1 Tax=Dermacentor silvarum TaxID=543639 RepID=A0ACB8C339_DERSI|nr:hypothetical protein HPB49_010570 [Dermacentor silvarum]
MPTAKGYLDGKVVTILRDTGYNTVVVKRSLVPDYKLTGSIHTIRLLDQENPLYEVVLGNVTGVLSETPHIPKQAQRPRSPLVRTDQNCKLEDIAYRSEEGELRAGGTATGRKNEHTQKRSCYVENVRRSSSGEATVAADRVRCSGRSARPLFLLRPSDQGVPTRARCGCLFRDQGRGLLSGSCGRSCRGWRPTVGRPWLAVLVSCGWTSQWCPQCSQTPHTLVQPCAGDGSSSSNRATSASARLGDRTAQRRASRHDPNCEIAFSTLDPPNGGVGLNESIAVLREVEKLKLSIPLSISFGMKGLYYAPKLANEASPKEEEFALFKACKDFASDKFGHPKEVCRKNGWVAHEYLPTYGHNLAEKRMITYLTEATVASLRELVTMPTRLRRRLCQSTFVLVLWVSEDLPASLAPMKRRGSLVVIF